MSRSLRILPFVRIVCPMVIGIAAADAIHTRVTPILMLITASLIIYGYAASSKSSGLIRKSAWIYFMLFLYGGALLINQKGEFQKTNTSDISSHRFLYQVAITSDVKRKKWFSSRARITAKYNIANQSWTKTDQPVQLFIEPSSERQTPRRGQILFTSARLQEVKSTPFPNAFDFKEYLARKGIYKQLFITSNQWVVLSSITGSKNLSTIIHTWRNQGLDRIDKVFERRHASIIKALVFGYREDVDENTLSSFTKTGSMHVLAVSGLHVGIVVYMLYSILNVLFPLKSQKDKFCLLVISPALLIFCLISGNAPPVRRATIMTVIALAGQLVPGKHSTLNFLFFTAFVLVISNPLIIYDVSFQLSFFAVLSILLFYPSISRAINHVVPLGKNLTPLISVSISAQMLTFPLILYYFHGFPLVFIISGVVAVIFAYIILCSTAMFFGIDIILPSYTAKAANLLTLVIDLFLDCILALSRIPFSNISRIWVTPIETLYMYAITIGIILLVKTGDWKLGVSLFICFGLLTYSLRSRGMRSKKQIVTHLYQKEPLLADIFIGQKCYELTQASIPLADKKFMVHNHRLAHGINRIQTVIMGDPKIISVE